MKYTLDRIYGSDQQLVINASMLDDKPTGAGVFSYNIINHLLKILPPEASQQVAIYAGSSKFLVAHPRINLLSSLAQAAKYKKIAALYRLLWNQLKYSLVARKYALSFSPTTHGSFFIGNQVITILDLLSLRYKNISLHQRFYFTHLLPILIRRARRIITISEASKQDIVRYFNCPPFKIDNIGCGYDDKLYRKLPADRLCTIAEKYGLKQFIVAVGPTFAHKNYERLLDAYSRVNSQLRQSTPLVVIGGRNSYVNSLRELVSNKGMSANVFFLGYVPLEEMPLFYNCASALIYPSLFEGFGLPPLEAMACGCPVVVSNTSSLPEVCGEAALYINPLDVDDMARAIEEVLTTETLRDALAAKGLVRAANFSWTKSALRLKAALEQSLPHCEA